MSHPTLRSNESRGTRGRWVLAAVLSAGILGVSWATRAPDGLAEDAGTPGATVPRVAQWSEEVLDLFGSLPVQAGGRVKPMSTWARFALLPMNHKGSCRTVDDEKRSALEWALDTFFLPETAKTHLMFKVENDEVITDLGLRFEDAQKRKTKKKSDHYSYKELEDGFQRLFQQGSRISRKMHDRDLELSDLPPIEHGLFTLAINVREFQSLMSFTAFTSIPVKTGDAPQLKDLFDGEDVVPLSRVIERAPNLLALAKGDGADDPKLQHAVARIGNALVNVSRTLEPLRILPPLEKGDREWISPWEVARAAFEGQTPSASHVKAIRLLEQMAANVGEPREFTTSLHAYHETVVEMAEARGEYEKIPLEVGFYKLAPFHWGMWFYIFGFLLMAFVWFKPQLKYLYWAVLALLGAAFVWHVIGIVIRCVIRERPPVSTLYETIIFIGGVGVLAGFIIEWINRQRIAISLAPVLGALSLWMAMGYEDLNRQDTMPQLVAVLDTNFWLAIHVVCIIIGYAAGLLAGVIAHLHVLGRVFGLKSGDTGFYQTVGRMLYGTLCFALLFSVVGTILGGIWANDSWGRFWGWDPKENGALMICLWQAMTLHARIGGFIRPHGLAMMTIFGTAVIVFSWWHVNLLGIGLHSYGFTKGILDKLTIFYLFEAAVLITGGTWWFVRRMDTGASAAS